MKPSHALARALERAYDTENSIRAELTRARQEIATLQKKGEGPAVNQHVIDAYAAVCDQLADRNTEIIALQERDRAKGEEIARLQQVLMDSQAEVISLRQQLLGGEA